MIFITLCIKHFIHFLNPKLMTAKKLFTLAVAAINVLGVMSQPRLRADNVDEVLQAMTLDEKCHLLLGCGMHFNDDAKFPGTAGSSYAVPRLGIPSIYCADGQQGLRMSATRPWDHRDYLTTDFPASMTVASTWDCEAAYAVGKAIGNEVKEYGLDWILAPSMNLMRSPLCGRNHEYYSEDPLLSGMIAAGYVQGVQSEGVAATPKHFVANNQETNRNNNDARVSQRALRELYLRAFEVVVKKGQPWTIMTSYNKLNGTYTLENSELLNTVVRKEWGWKGMFVSDWNAGQNPVLSMIAGNDMLQPGQDRQYKAIHEAVESGRLPMAVLDANVRRVLRLIVKTHSFAQYPYQSLPDLQQHADVVRRVAADGMVLLKNNHETLPLSQGRIALFGNTSYELISGGSGFGGMSTGHYTVSLVEGLRAAGFTVNEQLLKTYSQYLRQANAQLFPHGKPAFTLAPPARPEEMKLSDSLLTQSARDADVAVFTIGRKSGEATDRPKTDFYLTAAEKESLHLLSQSFHKAGKKVVVLLDICSPVDVTSWQDDADAILCTWQGGQEMGFAVADVLSGKVNPSGKLSMTFERSYGDAYADRNFPSEVDDKTLGSMFMWGNNDQQAQPRELQKDIDFTNYDEDIYVGYRYFDSFGKPVAYPFGYGLSYTTFDYSDMKVKKEGGNYSVAVTVENTGKRPGRNVVELFVAAPDSRRLNKPEKELRAFAKTRLLAPGERQTVEMTVTAADLASFNEKKSAWVTDAGVYRFLVCSSAEKVEAQANVRVDKYVAKVHNVLKPKVKLDLLHR